MYLMVCAWPYYNGITGMKSLAPASLATTTSGLTVACNVTPPVLFNQAAGLTQHKHFDNT